VAVVPVKNEDLAQTHILMSNFQHHTRVTAGSRGMISRRWARTGEL